MSTAVYYSAGKIYAGVGMWGVDFIETGCYDLEGTHNFTEGENVMGRVYLKEKYKCDRCLRDNFDKPSPHKCLPRGTVRKRGLNYIKRIVAIPFLSESNGRGIYFDKRIYVGCTQKEPQYHEFEPEEGQIDWNQDEQYSSAQSDFTHYLATLTNYSVIGTHTFKDGQTVVEGEDYELEHCEDSLDLNQSTNGNKWTTVAIPLLAPLCNEGMQKLIDTEFENVGDEGLFPNHSDKEVWANGFRAGFTHPAKAQTECFTKQQAENIFMMVDRMKNDGSFSSAKTKILDYIN